MKSHELLDARNAPYIWSEMVPNPGPDTGPLIYREMSIPPMTGQQIIDLVKKVATQRPGARAYVEHVEYDRDMRTLSSGTVIVGRQFPEDEVVVVVTPPLGAVETPLFFEPHQTYRQICIRRYPEKRQKLLKQEFDLNTRAVKELYDDFGYELDSTGRTHPQAEPPAPEPVFNPRKRIRKKKDT